MSSVVHLVKETARGIVIGVANIIPGVSGGTMAVSMGIYDKLIEAVTDLRKSFKKSLLFLLPYLIGAALGIVALSFVVRHSLQTWPLQTAGLFIGLIIGGLPVILKNFRGAKINIGHVVKLIAFFLLVIFMSLNKDIESTATDFNLNPIMIIQLFAVGMIAAATMIIPGVSGSMVLMILGFYNGIISNISQFIKALLSFDMAGITHGLGVFIPFGIGILIGIALIAKLIRWLFANAPISTYAAITGLILASPIAIMIETGCDKPQAGTIAVAIVLMVVGLAISAYMSREAE